MDANFPKRIKNITDTGELLNNMVAYGISLEDLNTFWTKIKPNFLKIEEKYIQDRDLKFKKWSQVGIARFILDIFDNRFRARHSTSPSVKILEDIYNKYFA